MILTTSQAIHTGAVGPAGAPVAAAASLVAVVVWELLAAAADDDADAVTFSKPGIEPILKKIFFLLTRCTSC